MNKREELHETLCDILGSRNCYFQPPETVKMMYPCIIYERDSIDSIYANNDKYRNGVRYTIRLIGKNPNNLTVENLLKLKYCSYDRHYVSDNLNHDVLTIHY